MVYVSTETLIDSISKRIGTLCAQAKMDSLNGRTTMAKDMERILLPLLRCLFDSPSLHASSDITEEGFDLTDDNGLLMQVSTRQDSTKFTNTLRSCHSSDPNAKVVFIVLDLDIHVNLMIWEKTGEKDQCIRRKRGRNEPYTCFTGEPKQDKKKYYCKGLTLLCGELYSAAELEGKLIDRYQGADFERQMELLRLDMDMALYKEPTHPCEQNRDEACLIAGLSSAIDYKGSDILSITNVGGTTAVNISIEVQSGMPLRHETNTVPRMFPLGPGDSRDIASLIDPGEAEYHDGTVVLSWMDSISGKQYVRNVMLHVVAEPDEEHPSGASRTVSLYDWFVENGPALSS